MEFLGITWVGVTAENGRKLLASLVLISAILVGSSLIRFAVGVVLSRTDHATVQTKFWTRQAVSLVAAVGLLFGLLSIWFSEPARLATAFGLMSAGLAFALQQVITAVAGYFVILRGSTFRVGDRISMGGVRGDVIQLGFIQTTIMEMGQPPNAPTRDHATWVKSRQFTGRVVTVSNSKIFSEPVFNYTRDFPYIWEELTVPLHFDAACDEAELILLEAAHAHRIDPVRLTPAETEDIRQRFGFSLGDFEPCVYWRMTHDWMELTVRFLTLDHGTRNVKDHMSRFIHAQFRARGISIAAKRYEILRGTSADG